MLKYNPIYVDMDDVLAETGQALLHCAQKLFGSVIKFEDMHDFNLQVTFKLTDHQMEQLFETIHEPEILMGLAPLPHAAATVEHLKSIGYPIHVMTGRPAGSQHVSTAWLNQNSIPFDHFEIVDKYRRDKTQALTTLEDLKTRAFAMAIEDAPAMAQFLATELKIPVLMIDRPWNRHHRMPSNVVRVHSWADIPSLI